MSGTSTGFTFGAPKPSTSGFGLGSTPAPAFGAQPSAQPLGSITFGTPIAAVAPTSQNTGLSFGTAAGMTPNIQSTTTGLSFGTPTPSFSLGTQPAAGSGFTFGAAPVTTSTAPAATGLSFGTTPSLGFGTGIASSAPTLGLQFGAPSTSAPTLGLSGSTLAGTSFGAPAASSLLPKSTASTGFSLSLSAPQQLQTIPTTFSLTSSQPPISLGLGGVANISNKAGASSAIGAANQAAVKENQIPNEIRQLVDTFKAFVKEQKSLSSDVARGSVRALLKVQEDIDVLTTVIADSEKDLQKNRQLADKLKHDTAQGLRNAEIAQRTNDTPPGFQFENTAPMQFFVELANSFEQELNQLRCQIDITDKHIQSLQNNRVLSSNELAAGMRKLHDTFVALAGRLQSVHNQVESEKEKYLSLRKFYLNDPSNVFLKKSPADVVLERAIKASSAVSTSPQPGLGPAPFANVTNSYLNSANLSQMDKPPLPPYTAPQNPTLGK